MCKLQSGEYPYLSLENKTDGQEARNKSSHVLTMKTFEIQENRASNSETNNIAFFHQILSHISSSMRQISMDSQSIQQ